MNGSKPIAIIGRGGIPNKELIELINRIQIKECDTKPVTGAATFAARKHNWRNKR
jgi:hypothetical protein